MARLGRGFPQRHLIKGFPPGTSPGPAGPTAPVGGQLGLTGGGRRNRGARTRPLVRISPRPIAGAGDVTISVTAASATWSAGAPALTVTIAATPGSGTWSAPAPGVSTGAVVVQHGGNETRFDGRTLADETALNAHLARLLDEERKRADDEALILLMAA